MSKEHSSHALSMKSNTLCNYNASQMLIIKYCKALVLGILLQQLLWKTILSPRTLSLASYIVIIWIEEKVKDKRSLRMEAEDFISLYMEGNDA